MLCFLFLQASTNPQTYTVGDDWEGAETESMSGFSDRASSLGTAAAFGGDSSQGLKDVVQLRRYFKAGYLYITEKNCDGLIEALGLYGSFFRSYNQGVAVSEPLDSDKLLTLLHVFTNVKRFKINTQLGDARKTAEIIAGSIQFYKMLSELNLERCGLDDEGMMEIVEGLLSANEPNAPVLDTLDVRNNNISQGFIAEMRGKFPHLVALKSDFPVSASPVVSTVSVLTTRSESTESFARTGDQSAVRTQDSTLSDTSRSVSTKVQGSEQVVTPEEALFNNGLASRNEGNIPKATEYFKQAAELGHAGAQFQLGLICFNAGKNEGAFAWFKKAAEKDYPEAQAHLSWMYAHGQGTTKDETQAFAWCQKAAQQGHIDAAFRLGAMYANGKGIATKDETQACVWYKKAAERGHANAQCNLGVMCVKGLGGLAKDEVAAFEWFRKAANQGLPEAENNLGTMYAHAKGVVQDDIQAGVWKKKAAEHGHVVAQFDFGVMCETGKGVSKDAKQAREWFKKAADKGYVPAQLKLQPSA